VVKVLVAAGPLCATQQGAARLAAAGLVAHAVALMRSPDPDVARTAVALCRNAAAVDATAKAALAREPDAVPALLALLCGGSPPWDDMGVKILALVAQLLGMLTRPEDRVAAAAAATAARTGGSTVTAAVVAGGGVARTVELLRAALGGGGQSPDIPSAVRLLGALNSFASTNPAAAAAARTAGAVPIAARAIVAAQRTPGPAAKVALYEALLCLARLAAADDLPALAARPDLIGALAGAVALAADGACEDWSAFQAEGLGNSASICVAQLLAGGQGSSDAAAEGFLAAGGAEHLVRGRARVCRCWPSARVVQGACMPLVRALGRALSGGAAAVACGHAHQPRGHPVQPLTLPPSYPQPSHRCGSCPASAHAATYIRTSSSPSALWRRFLWAAAPCWRPARRPPSGPRPWPLGRQWHGAAAVRRRRLLLLLLLMLLMLLML
jgi:hypothetical protein